MESEVLDYLGLLFSLFWQYIKSWYWLFLPLILVFPNFKKFPHLGYWWHYWRYETRWKAAQMKKIYEIKLPKEIEKPISAMEMCLEQIWKGFYEPPYFWEFWWQGKHHPMDFQFEIVSDGGRIKFYLRTVLGYKIEALKRAIWSHYPDIEFVEAEDYVRKIPVDLERKGWEMRGADFGLEKPDVWPLNTYLSFEKTPEAIPKGEEKKKVEPMGTLLEMLTQLKEGEKVWFQIKPFPIGGEEVAPYLKSAEELKNKIAQRGKPVRVKSWVDSFFNMILTLIEGKRETKKEEREGIELVAPELRMTPREKEICQAIERKFSKPLFLVSSIRWIYFAKKEVFNPHQRWRQMLNFTGAFCAEDMNSLKNVTHTYTKIVNPPPFNLFDKRRLYVRKRRMIRLYQNRYEPRYPLKGDYRWAYMVLCSEELASIFHFPTRVLVPLPGIERVEFKKTEAPPEVPME